MKLLALSIIFLSLTSCGSFKKNQGDDPTKIKEEPKEEPVAEVDPSQPVQDIEVVQEPKQGLKMTYGEICESFLSTLQSGSVDQMSQHFPTIAVARAISGKAASGKTDEEMQVMIDDLTTRFMSNIEKLRTAANESNVELNTLRVRNCLYFDSEQPNSMMNFLTSELNDGSKDYKITMSIANYGGKTYAREIIKTTNVFNKH
jgi:hypothetical protein